MERHPEVALTYGTHLVWFSWSGAIEHAAMDRELPPSPLADRVAQPPEAVREFLNDRSIAGTSSLFVRREHALEVGGFEESLAWAEDQTLTYKIGLRRPIFISSELMHRYRKHPGATTTLLEAKGRRFTSQLLFLDWVGRLFKEEGVRDADLWVALYLRKAKYQRTVLRERSTRAFRNAARKVRRGLKSRGRRLRLSWIGLWLADGETATRNGVQPATSSSEAAFAAGVARASPAAAEALSGRPHALRNAAARSAKRSLSSRFSGASHSATPLRSRGCGC
jgi:hypothetical protein